MAKIKCLGHIVSAKGVTANLEKVMSILAYPVPKNLTQVQQILGLPGWYHRFVPGLQKPSMH